MRDDASAALGGRGADFLKAGRAESHNVLLKPEVNGALANHALVLARGAHLSPSRQILAPSLASGGAAGREQREIAARLATAHEELKSIRQFDYVIINEQAPPERRDSLPAVDDLEAIVRAERFRIHHYKDDDLKKLETS